jgi:hypothetical protein
MRPTPQSIALCERDARVAVDRAKPLGYDFVKAYERLQPHIYTAVVPGADMSRYNDRGK